MRNIVVHEGYDKIYISEDINDKCIGIKEVDELERLIKKEKLKQENISWDRKSICFINYVGFIKLSTVIIEILPKVDINNNIENSRKRLLQMLSKSGILDVKFSEIYRIKNYNINLNEIMAVLFAKKFQIEISKGLYSEYIGMEENVNILKGKLIIKNNIKNICNGSSKAYCKFEELSVNNSLNQILKYTVNFLIKQINSVETLKILRHINIILGDVSDCSINKLDKVDYKLNRLNKRFESVFNIAKQIIKGESNLDNRGLDKSYSILFEMNFLFERYITMTIGNIIEKGTLYKQHSKYKLLVNEDTGRGVFNLKPDIVIEVGGTEKIVIDTKWKIISEKYNRHGVKREDLYQMYAYLTRYRDVEEVVLLYPRASEEERDLHLESWMLEDNQSKKIKVYTINLESENSVKNKLSNIISI